MSIIVGVLVVTVFLVVILVVVFCVVVSITTAVVLNGLLVFHYLSLLSIICNILMLLSLLALFLAKYYLDCLHFSISRDYGVYPCCTRILVITILIFAIFLAAVLISQIKLA